MRISILEKDEKLWEIEGGCFVVEVESFEEEKERVEWMCCVVLL